MHPNPAFRNTPDARTLAFARDRAFGTLAVNAERGPLLAHVPFLLSPDADRADIHLVRSNPIVRLLDRDAVIAVTGPDGYVSPDWYEVSDQVPTWNYVSVHIRGRLSRLPDEAMRDMLDRQSAAYEARLAPKAPWTAAKMTPEVLERMMRAIVPCRLDVMGIDATWKLSQNKPDAVRLRAAEKMETGLGTELGFLAELMRDPDLTKL
ncbi:MAG: FMN-binding negative transcriptional regulator [Jannaschia sp.]